MINEKIFGDANDKYVRNYVLYCNRKTGDASDPLYAFHDRDCTKEVSAEELKNYFVKGCLIDGGDSESVYYIVPTAFEYVDSYARIYCVVADSESVSSILIYSSEYIPEPDEDDDEEEDDEEEDNGGDNVG